MKGSVLEGAKGSAIFFEVVRNPGLSDVGLVVGYNRIQRKLVDDQSAQNHGQHVGEDIGEAEDQYHVAALHVFRLKAVDAHPCVSEYGLAVPNKADDDGNKGGYGPNCK